MSEVQFDEQSMIQPNQNFYKPRGGGLMGFVIKQGFAKDESQASLVLLGVAVFFFVVAILIVLYSTGTFDSKPNKKDTRTVQQITNGVPFK